MTNIIGYSIDFELLVLFLIYKQRYAGACIKERKGSIGHCGYS
jgi:hypothetical protein